MDRSDGGLQLIRSWSAHPERTSRPDATPDAICVASHSVRSCSSRTYQLTVVRDPRRATGILQQHQARAAPDSQVRPASTCTKARASRIASVGQLPPDELVAVMSPSILR